MHIHSTASSSSSSTTSSRHSHSQSTSVLHPRPRTASETPYHHHHTSSLSSHSREHPQEERENILSGSETERDIDHRLSLAESNSSDDQSYTPPSTASISALRMTGMVQPTPTSPHRPRRISLPTSPGKALTMSSTKPRRNLDRSISPGPSRTPKKRPSTANSVSEKTSPVHSGRDASLDLTSAALAAVARSRSPATLSTTSGGSRGQRAGLPREFMGRDRHSLDGKVGHNTGYLHSPLIALWIIVHEFSRTLTSANSPPSSKS